MSLPDDTAHLLDALAARVANGNVSLVVEVALQRLIREDFDETERLVQRRILDRMVTTRVGWMRVFWQRLGAILDQPDMIDNVRAPRQFEGFYAALLLHHVAHEDNENDPFHVVVGPQQVVDGSPAPHQWTFPRSTPPDFAAKAVADKLRQYGVQAKS